MEETHLNPPGGHAQLRCKLYASGAIWLCVALKDAFKGLELVRGGSLAMLHLVWSVGIESAEVNGIWVH